MGRQCSHRSYKCRFARTKENATPQTMEWESCIDFRFGPITLPPFSPLPSSAWERTNSPPLPSPPPTPYPCHCSPSCVRDNGISHCFIHKCDVTINRDRGQEAREYGIWWGLEGWREGERRFKGRHSPRIRNRYEIWLCMNDVSRDHCYLQSLLPPSRSATDPWREGERRRRT